MADYDIFRNQLLQTFPTYGYALWDPNPTKPDKPVKVGDVGFTRWGKFHRLFNALLPADHPSHELDVPEYHEPLVPNLVDHINMGSLNCGHYCSGEVNIEPEPNTSASSPDDLPQVSYMCARRRQGALSFLPVNVRRENTLARGDFGEWMLKHSDTWFAFARRLGLGIVRMEEIILVTGCDRTKSWTNVTFLGNNVDARVSFGVNAVDGPNPSINFQFSPEKVRGAVVNRGPEGTNLPENQCVFIRGFRVARTRILPKHLKAAAGPSPDPEGYNYEPGMELVSITEDTKYRDPLHELLDHVAERTPDCSMVLVHDDDLERINGIGEGTTPQPDVLMDLFKRSNIEIYEVDYDLPSSTSNPNADNHAVRVAMLSAMFKNWKIAKDTALQSQASSLATQNISTRAGIRPPRQELSSLLVPWEGNAQLYHPGAVTDPSHDFMSLFASSEQQREGMLGAVPNDVQQDQHAEAGSVLDPKDEKKKFREHRCEHCGKQYGRAQELRRHTREYHEQRPQCPFCYVTWTCPEKIGAHLITEHGDRFTEEQNQELHGLRGRRKTIHFIAKFHREMRDSNTPL